jgi:hypothetical protein
MLGIRFNSHRLVNGPPFVWVALNASHSGWFQLPSRNMLGALPIAGQPGLRPTHLSRADNGRGRAWSHDDVTHENSGITVTRLSCTQTATKRGPSGCGFGFQHSSAVGPSGERPRRSRAGRRVRDIGSLSGS